MVIDLQKCVGCGACGITCKTENNTKNRKNGQSYNWADYLITIEGKFPNVTYISKPTLCNHCTDAPCVASCPVSPKAMFKTPEGITMHNDDRCIGCRNCQHACPYSTDDLAENPDVQYSVISFNFEGEGTFSFFEDKTEVIKDCTGSGAEIATKTGALPPMKTEYTHPDYDDVRRAGIVEKCILCAHRLARFEQPYCVERCPSQARSVGDFDDPNSNVSKLIRTHKSEQLKADEGTKPNVHYIRSFKVKA